MMARALGWSRRDEAPVIDRAPTVDEARFRELYHRFSRPVWTYLRRVTGDAATADDLLQDTFCRYLTAGPPEADMDAIRGWLFRVAGNLAMDHFRRQGRAPRPLDDVEEPRAAAHQADVLAARSVRETFGQLEPRERAVLWMAYVEDASHRDIAEAIGVREGSVRVMLFRARQRLGTLLSKLRRTS